MTISLSTHPLFLSTSLLYPLFLVVSSAKDCHSCLRFLGVATSMCPHDPEHLLEVLMCDTLLDELFAVVQKSHSVF